MAINELLLETLVRKNSGVSFALEESMPLQGTYARALPLGPIMELNVRTNRETFTKEVAARSVDYWRKISERLLVDSEAVSAVEAMKSYAHDAGAAANLLAANGYTVEAEQVYRLAMRLSSDAPEPIMGFAKLLEGEGRGAEARRLLDESVRKLPGRRPER